MIDRRASLSRVLSLLGLGFATLPALDGCGAGQVGAAVRPKEATAAEGIGEGPCREADNSGEPLVVDWKPEQRGDLELLMKENVANRLVQLQGLQAAQGLQGRRQLRLPRHRRACDGTQSQACIDVGKIYESNRDVIGAKIMYQRGCWRGNMQACFDNGRMELGFGGQKDAAKRAFEMGCMRNDKMSCAAMKVLFGGHQPVFPGPETMDASRRCDMGGSATDCGVAGLINLATNNPMGQNQIERACMQQDGLACAVKAATKK